MPELPVSQKSAAVSRAFELAFENSRSPLPYEAQTDEELLPVLRERVPGASQNECREALALVRGLCDSVYEVCGMFRDGRFGTGPEAVRHAIAALSQRHPGFSAPEYEKAFAAGLLWTAF
jgi:hypothetical protein